MPNFRRALFTAVAAPAMLALAACGSGDGGDGGPATGEPIAPIAAPAGTNWAETANATPEQGFAVGNPDAPLKLVEYASHTCGVCAAFSQEAGVGMEKYIASGVVSYEIRNQVHNALDLTIALLARCGAPEAFHPLASQAWSNFNEVMQNADLALQAASQAPEGQRYQTIAEVSGLLDFFAARGISRDQATQCLTNSGRVDEIVEASTTQSDELGVTGTPTFFLNGRRIEGTNWASVEAALQAAGAR